MSKQYAKKISIAACGIDSRAIEKIVEGKGNQATPVLRVYGRIKDSKPGSTDLGPYVSFSGEFEAVNLFTGAKIRSQKCILPTVAEQFLSDTLDAAKRGEGFTAVEFGLDITAMENASKKGGMKFKYGVEAHQGHEGKDMLDEIGSRLGNPPLLSAPEATAKGRK